jgi:hypothetical protein
MAAATDMAEHTIGHRDLEKTIPEEITLQWTAEVKAWENDKDQPNPYEITAEGKSLQQHKRLLLLSDETSLSGPTQASIRREIAEQEAKDLEAGNDFCLDKNMSPAVLISSGLDLEAEQYDTLSFL